MNDIDDLALDRNALQAAELPPYPGLPLSGITLVTGEPAAAKALAALLTADAIGFDTESKPTFLKGEVSDGPHLVQLASNTHAWLLPTAIAANLPVLKVLLESTQLRKIGFGLGNDRSALQSRLGISLANVLDLGEILRGPGHRGTVGAKMAVAHFFGQRLQKSKKIGTSNWATPRLSERQQLYAANDAHVALRIYREWQKRGGSPAGD
jgi:RNA polymerase sigma factor for flagellar operon FliA